MTPVKFVYGICTFFLFINMLSVKSQSLSPGVRWSTVGWAPVDFSLQNPQSQSQSSDEWWYAHTNLYDPNTGDQLGYIAVGYISWREQIYDEDNGEPYTSGCHIQGLDQNDPQQLWPKPDRFEFTDTEHTPDGRWCGAFWAAIARFDLEGNMIWCRRFVNGQLHGVIQNRDGDILATGLSTSTVYKNSSGGESSLIYNPGLNNETNVCQSGDPDEGGRRLYLVKVDMDGNLIRNYVYGLETNPADFMDVGSFGGGLIEVPASAQNLSGYIVVGQSGEVGNPDPQGFVLNVDNDLEVVSMKGYHESNRAIGLHAVEYYIDQSTNEEYYAISGKINTDDPTPKSMQQPVNAPQLFFTVLDEDLNDRFTPQVIIDPDDDNNHDIGICQVFSISFSSDGDVYLPAIYKRDGSLHKGEAFVFKLSASTGSSTGWSNPIDVGPTRTYDMRIGITRPSYNDGHFAVVSSRHADKLPEHSDITNYLPVPNNDADYWTTTGASALSNVISVTEDANGFVKKYIDYGSSAAELWDVEFDVDKTHSSREYWPGDIKKQECLYTITHNDDGSFTVAGNCSPNFDDSYIVNVDGDCGRYLTYDGLELNEYGEYRVTSNETWNSGNNPSPVRGQIIVESGYTLTIDGITVEFADTKTCGELTNITVEAGGHLYVTNSTLTSLSSPSCTEYINWDGIQVLGDPDENHSLAYQGKITLDNSRIENSKAAVTLGRMHYTEYLGWESLETEGGGIIHADDATFENNRYSLHFAPYEYSIDHPGTNTSYLEDCDFKNTSAIPGYLGTGMSHYVSMWLIQDIEFIGCYFTNDFAVSSGVGASGTALGGTDCGFEVYSSAGRGASKFENLDYGIEVYQVTMSDYPIDILSAEFTDNFHGIYITNSFWPIIAGNTFNIGIPGISITGSEHYGIYLFDSDEYKVEINYLYDQVEHTNYGILVDNTSDPGSTNRIYRNDFHDLYLGLSGLGENRGSDEYEGLKFMCNEFNNYEYAMFAGNDDDSGISELQGIKTGTDEYTPASNKFNDDCTVLNGKFYNSVSSIDYVEDMNEVVTLISDDPSCYSSSTISIIDQNSSGSPTINDNSCDELEFTDDRPTRQAGPSLSTWDQLNKINQQIKNLKQKNGSSYSWLKSEANRLLSEYARQTLRSGDKKDLEQLISYFEASEERNRRLQLVDLYIRSEDERSAKNELNDIERKYPETSAYVEFKRTLLDYKMQGVDLEKMKNDKELMAVTNQLATDQELPGSMSARGLKKLLYNEDIQEVFPEIQLDVKEPDNLISFPEFEISCYPNPFTTDTRVVLKKTHMNENYDFVLFDVNGKQVFHGQLSSENPELHINGNSLNSGVYIGFLSNGSFRSKGIRMIKMKN